MTNEIEGTMVHVSAMNMINGTEEIALKCKRESLVGLYNIFFNRGRLGKNTLNYEDIWDEMDIDIYEFNYAMKHLVDLELIRIFPYLHVDGQGQTFDTYIVETNWQESEL